MQAKICSIRLLLYFLLWLCLLITVEISCSTELLPAFFFYGQNCQIMAHIKKRMSLLFPAYRLCHCYSIPSKGKCNCPVSSRGGIWNDKSLPPLFLIFKSTLNNSICTLQKYPHWIIFQNCVLIFTKHLQKCTLNHTKLPNINKTEGEEHFWHSLNLFICN